jgi:hypothetical protein
LGFRTLPRVARVLEWRSLLGGVLGFMDQRHAVVKMGFMDLVLVIGVLEFIGMPVDRGGTESIDMLGEISVMGSMDMLI